MKTMLIVDDEPRTRHGMQQALIAWSAEKLHIESASSGVEALEMMKAQTYDVIITDVRMPEIDGLRMLEILATRGKLPVVIVISGYAEFDYAKKSLQLGVFDYLLKPVDKAVLVDTVQRALEKCSSKERLDVVEKFLDPELLEVNTDKMRYSAEIQGALDYIDEHLNEAISMKYVAELIHLNSSYFSVLFKEQTGFTFSEYLTRSRLQRAKEMLITTRMPVWEIAEKVGYQTARYFIKVFKENEGASPTQYRQQMFGSNSIIQ